MNKGLKTVIWIVVIVVVIWLIASSAGKGGPSAQNATSTVPEVGPTYKVGVMVPLTGDAAVYGEPARNVYQIAADEINAEGGIGGKPIEFVVEDSKCTGEGGANSAQKLVNVDKVQAIIGGVCSGETLSAIPVVEAGKVALFSPGASSPDLTGKSPYFFRNYPSDSSQGTVIAEAAYSQGKRKVAFIQELTDYPLGIYNAFKEKFESLGGTVIKEEYPTESKDFRSQLSKLKDQKPDALFIDGQAPASMERILSQLSQLGWKIPLLSNDILMTNKDVVAKYKSLTEGMVSAEVGTDLANPKFKHLVDAYKAKYNVDLPYPSYAQDEYDAVYILKTAILAVGYDGTKIAAFGHSISDWQGAAGSVTIGTNGDVVGGHRAEIVKNGKVVVYVK